MKASGIIRVSGNVSELKNTLLLIIFCAVVSTSQSFAQNFYTSRVFPVVAASQIKLKDSLPGKCFKFAAGGLLLAEVTPWVVDNYIRKVDYTQISWHTLGYNINPAHWSWDGDGFTTNQFGHPYHGSLFFNSFRSNGYNFWQSSLASFAGSYLWETAAENQAPAPNDFINTGFGGIILGEMTHRLSKKIINKRSAGFGRHAREAAALIINPVNGFGRIINGTWGNTTSTTTAADSIEMYTELDGGLRQFRNNKQQGRFGLYGHVKFMYGVPYSDSKIPFTHILLNAEFGKDDSSGINIVSIYGSLRGWKVYTTVKNKNYLVLTANYDYIRNSAFFYSAQSIKLNLFSSVILNRKLAVNTSLAASGLLLAAVPDVHGYKSRYYNYCIGTGFSGGFNLNIAGRFFAALQYRGGWLKTVNGNASHYFLHAVSGEAGYVISKGWSVCAEPGYFTLHANYSDYDDVHKIYPYIRYSLRYSFKIR